MPELSRIYLTYLPKDIEAYLQFKSPTRTTWLNIWDDVTLKVYTNIKQSDLGRLNRRKNIKWKILQDLKPLEHPFDIPNSWKDVAL